MMPSFVCGVINLRGSVVPMMDLQVNLGKCVTPIVRCTAIVSIDAVKEVMDIARKTWSLP
jgi:purine-binding chemotaxis protein CheW